MTIRYSGRLLGPFGACYGEFQLKAWTPASANDVRSFVGIVYVIIQERTYLAGMLTQVNSKNKQDFF